MLLKSSKNTFPHQQQLGPLLDLTAIAAGKKGGANLIRIYVTLYLLKKEFPL